MYDEYRTGPLQKRVKQHLFVAGAGGGAAGPGFVVPVESPVACGASPEQAYERWRDDVLTHPEWKGKLLPELEEFTIE